MGVQRSFTAKCDKCEGVYGYYNFTTATELRKVCKENKWTISGNKFTCPACNRNHPTYRDEYEEMVDNNEGY